MPSNMGAVIGDLSVSGTLYPVGISLPASCVGSDEFNASDPLAVAKQVHQYIVGYAQPNTAAADETRPIHVCRGAATIVAVKAGSIAAAVGDATCTVDILKNGVSIMTAVITLDSGNAAYTPEAGAITTTTGVANDVYTTTFNATIGTGTLPTGVYVTMVVNEAAS